MTKLYVLGPSALCFKTSEETAAVQCRGIVREFHSEIHTPLWRAPNSPLSIGQVQEDLKDGVWLHDALATFYALKVATNPGKYPTSPYFQFRIREAPPGPAGSAPHLKG